MDIMKSIPHIYFEKFPMFDDQISQFGTDSTMFDYQHCSNTTCSSIRSNIHSNGSANSSSLSNHQNIENDSQDELSFSPRPTDDNSMESNENSTKCISPIDCTEDVSNQDSTNVIFENDNISVPSGAKDLIINSSSNVISPPLHHHTYIQSHKNRRKSSEPLKVMVNHTLRGPLKKRIKLNEQFNCYFNTTSINNDDSDIKNNNSNNINIDKNNKNIDNIDNENEKDCKIENITVDTDDKKINIIVDQHSSNSIENKHFRPWDTTTNNETSTFDQDIQDEPLALLTKKKCIEPKSIPMAMPLLKQNSSKEFIKQYIPSSSSSSPPPPPLSLVVPLSPALPPPPPPPTSSHHQIYLPIIPRSSTSPNSCTLPLTLSPAVVPSVRSSTITESILPPPPPPPPPPTSVSSSSSLVGYYGDNKYTSRNHSSTASPNSSQSMPPSPSSHSFKSTTNNNKLTKKHRNTSKSVSNLKSSSASPAHHHLQHQQQQQQQRNYKNMTKARRIEANARERSRVHTISAAYETLRKNVPSYSNTQKLSKLSVLRIAISYIDTLKRIANGDEDDAEDGDDDDDDDDRSLTTTNENNHRNQLSLSELVSEVTKTIQTEGKIRKKKDE